MSEYALTKQKSSEKIAKNLSKILASTYVLYVKTQNFHWNVVDPRFISLHQFFEEQYENLAKAIDEIAERIRMLQEVSPASMREFLRDSSLKESEGNLSADTMLKQLLSDHEKIAKEIHALIESSNENGDNGTGDLLIGRIRFHEKTAWMIRSHLGKRA